MAFEEGAIHKRYIALVEGRLETARLIDRPLVEARKNKMRLAREGEASKPSKTWVKPRTLYSHATLVELEPLTGRTHQLRVHLKAEGHPLLFDHQYGRKVPLTSRELGGEGDEIILARTPLHAERLVVDGLPIEAPMPDDIAAALERLSK